MRVIIVTVSAWFLLCGTGICGYFQNPDLVAKLEALYQSDMDPLGAKLSVDFMLDPAQDPVRIRAFVDELSENLVTMTKDLRTNDEKLQALRALIYRSGPWNGNRPFAYDMVDPLGKRPENRLLGHYFMTRLGNCVTMPLLFLILGKRIGLPVALANAPYHFLIKYSDDSGVQRNVETTSGGGFSRDEWVRKQIPMNDNAIAHGIYLHGLNQSQTISAITTILMEDFYRKHKFDDAVVVANVILSHDPRNIAAVLTRSSSFGFILQRDFTSKYKSEADMPAPVRAFAYRLMHASQDAFAFAQSLGWSETDGQIAGGEQP